MTEAAPAGIADAPRAPRFGERAPRFLARSNVNPRFAFDTVAGRYVLLVFLSGDWDADRAAVEAVAGRRDLFDDDRCVAFVVAPSEGHDAGALHAKLRVFFDDGGQLSALFGGEGARGAWLFDPGLRLLVRTPASEITDIFAWLERAPSPDGHAGVTGWAPVLLAPRIFEPEFCRALIDYYRQVGGRPSGFMREVDGRTVLLHDRTHKRREDVTVEDPRLAAAARQRIVDRLAPQIQDAFQFKATRMERYLVARYDAGDQGFFRAHRDNTTSGTAHRRFAVTLNLNAGDYEGGELRFPEYGRRTYKPPTGGAVVFSCSLLHEATPVTSGERFAFLPFLYDEAGAAIRERNAALVEGGSGYRK